MRPAFKVFALGGTLLLIWSAIFATTFQYPFYWDDFHLIRTFTKPEIISVFHGVVDPDKIETPSLRPCSTLLYNIQGSLFGENVVAQRAFMIVLVAIFLSVVGLLMLELDVPVFQIAFVFSLLIFSRIFAALVLWITLGPLIFAYIFISLTAYFFFLWVKRRRISFLLLTQASAVVATFTREEAYTLPVTLPLLWWIYSSDRRDWRPVLVASLSILVIVSFHYALSHFLIPDAISPRFSHSAVNGLIIAIKASGLPGGYKMNGAIDKLLGRSWTILIIAVTVIFLLLGRPRVRNQFLILCGAVAILALPALGQARPFGIALPTLAFLTALSISLVEIQHQTRSGNWSRIASAALTILVLALGTGSGLRRSIYVKESLREDCVIRIKQDGNFLFDCFSQPATIPRVRRQAGLARLAAFGIKSNEDLDRLKDDIHRRPDFYERNRETGDGLFLPKYRYLSF